MSAPIITTQGDDSAGDPNQGATHTGVKVPIMRASDWSEGARAASDWSSLIVLLFRSDELRTQISGSHQGRIQYPDPVQ